MKLYKVSLTRTETAGVTVMVMADSEQEALQRAENEAYAGDHDSRFYGVEQNGEVEREFEAEFYYPTGQNVMINPGPNSPGPQTKIDDVVKIEDLPF